jgi:two-component system, NtrC family, sensor histidine kinase PilS
LNSSVQLNFLSEPHARRVIRTLTLAVYFVIFQGLILLQKPFLQFDFIVIFYLAFGGLFAHHLVYHFVHSNPASKSKSGLFSYFFDFLILILFMKNFPYLSSFILVLQLFLLFIASFDLEFLELCLLGFIASLGASLINLSTYQSGSIQSLLSLTLFNLSYLSVIIISRQLKFEFFNLQTDLSQTRKKSRTQEQFLKSLVEKLPFGLAVLDNKQDFVLQNSYLLNDLKLTEDKLKELIGKYNQRSIHAGPDVLFAIHEGADKMVFNFDKARYFDEEVSEELDLYLVKDVTSIRLLEEQARQNEKLAAVGQLAAGIAHEIRNPLAGISGSIQMLAQEESQDPNQKKLMQIVLREIDRLNLLITEFLNYAKPEKSPDTPISLKQVLEELITTLKSHPEATAGLQWKVQLQEAYILGFSEKLKQALLNIIINAIQSMKVSPSPSIEINLRAIEQRVVLSIKDSGSGMSEENRKKMFEPFHTTKHKGTGLGLAITHKILETHKAEIEVRSEINIGTEFIIKFPLTGSKEEDR